MGTPIKLTSIGNSTGLILSKDIMARLKVSKGDTLYLTESEDGYLLTPYDETFAEQMKAGEKHMRKYRDVLRALAK